MAFKPSQKLPIGPLRDLLAWWRKSKVPGVIIGGLAVALSRRARTTRDVDALISLEPGTCGPFLKTGERFSFFSRIPEPLRFAESNRMLLLHHKKSKTDVDISLGALPFEMDTIKRGRSVKVGRLSVPIASVEDLIILKAVANRHIDKIDIAGLLDSHSELDFAHIRTHIDEFAQILESPELYTDLDAMIREQQKAKRRKTK